MDELRDELRDELNYHKEDARKWQQQATNARRTAEYWKAEHLAANKENCDLVGALKFLANSREPDAVDYAFSVLQKAGDGGTAFCSWWEGDDGGPWATQCNELFNLTEGTPTKNGMRFCCFCGKVMNEVVADDDFDSTEKWKDENL